METIKRTKIVDVLKSDAFGTTVNVKGTSTILLTLNLNLYEKNVRQR